MSTKCIKYCFIKTLLEDTWNIMNKLCTVLALGQILNLVVPVESIKQCLFCSLGIKEIIFASTVFNRGCVQIYIKFYCTETSYSIQKLWGILSRESFLVKFQRQLTSQSHFQNLSAQQQSPRDSIFIFQKMKNKC